MTTQVHQHPNECLPYLDFQYDDGGGKDYFHKHLSSEVPEDIQDCSVIAVSLATRIDPSANYPELSYAEALRSLQILNNRSKPWNSKRFYESNREFWERRVRQFVLELTTVGIPKHRNPIYGIETNIYASCLRKLGAYSLVFGELCEAETFCLCTAKGNLVIDGYSVIEGIDRYDIAHVTAVQNGVVKGPADISHGSFEVIHVWQRTW